MVKEKGGCMESVVEEPVYALVNAFFRQYLVERDAAGALALLSDEIYSVGTGDGEVAIGKAELAQLLDIEFSQLPGPILYTMSDYVQKERVPDCWDCFCNIKAQVSLPDGIQAVYHMRLTAGVHRQGERYVIDTLHASESSKFQEEGEFYPLKFISRGTQPLSRETRCELMKLIGQIMPGGIMGGYLEEGFPLYVANERLLEMAGYDSYQDFEEDIQGLVINSIHPDEREYVSALMDHVQTPGDQYEIEYRMKKKDGSYMWVHDIGRRTVADDGRNAIISVMTDISQQVYTRNRLEHQAITDPLTEIYNRKGAQERIAQAMPFLSSYLFLMLDLDNFKRVNDVYGHKEGDRVLCAVAKLLTKTFRKSDVVCRLGGDEFAVFVIDCEDLTIIRKKIQWIIDSYESMMKEHWPEAHSSLSAGGVFGHQHRTFPELYQQADEVLYQVKDYQKGQFKLHVLE